MNIYEECIGWLVNGLQDFTHFSSFLQSVLRWIIFSLYIFCCETLEKLCLPHETLI